MKKIHIHKNKKGFSLIELIIYMGLLAALLVVLSQVFTSIIQSRLDSESTASIDQDADYLISRFTYDISRAESISAPNTFTPGSTLTISISGNNYTYAISGGNLQLTTNLGIDNLNNYNTTISNLQFTRIGNGVSVTNRDSIKVNFTISSLIRRESGTESRDYEITVAPK